MTKMTLERAIQIARTVLSGDTSQQVSHMSQREAYRVLVEMNVAEKGDHKGLPVEGYRATQPQEAMDVVNANKRDEERVLRTIDALTKGQTPDGRPISVDPRWVAIAKTQLEQGFMSLNRAIFQPQRIALPGDDAVEVTLIAGSSE